MARTVASRKISRSNYGGRRVKRKYAPRSNRLLTKRYSRGRRRRVSAVRRTLPDFTSVALKWSQSTVTGFSASPAVGYDFNMNSLHDFNASGGTGQCFGYNQFSAFFQKYRVHAVKYKIMFYNPTAMNQNDLSCFVWCGPHDSVPAGSDVQILKQLPRSQCRVMSLKQGSSKRVTLKGFQMMYKLQGCSKLEYNTDLAFEAQIGENPSSMPKMKVIVCDLQDNTNNGSMAFDIEAVFYAKMFRRRMMGLS